MGEITRIADALRTIQGICSLYSVRDYTPIDTGRIAVYNVRSDNFHFFKWDSDKCQYVYDGSDDYIPNWRDKKMAI